MLLADGNGPIITDAPTAGLSATVSPTPFVFSGVLPQQAKGFDWWLVVFVLAVLAVIIAILIKLKK